MSPSQSICRTTAEQLEGHVDPMKKTMVLLEALGIGKAYDTNTYNVGIYNGLYPFEIRLKLEGLTQE